MTPDEKRIKQKLKDNFPHYASKCLKIRTKSGSVEPFILNKAQLHIHEQLELQKSLTGKVRALCLKGRQQGCSTYVGGRFYHKVTHHFGTQAFILTHALDATQNLYKMAQRFYENTPKVVRPQVTTSNSKELIFGILDSGYKLGTAENKAVGRSATIQLLHGSEVAFWNNASEHAKGIMQAVPSQPKTEIILESTANGVGNFFHEQWQQAEAAISDYIAIFVPWYWQPEYWRGLDDNFGEPTLEEEELIHQYGLTPNQVYWRRYKITELGVNGQDGQKAFRQEYPCIVGTQRVGTTGGIVQISEVKQHTSTTKGSIKKQWYSGEKVTIALITSLGYRLECTLDHPIPTIDNNLLKASELIGHKIGLGIPSFATSPPVVRWNSLPCIDNKFIISKDFSLFLGFFMGDGSFYNNNLSIVFNKRDQDAANCVVHLVNQIFGRNLQQRKTSSNGIELRACISEARFLFEKLGLISTNGKYTKRKVCVPEIIWRSPREIVKEFLKGLFDADGFASSHGALIKFYSKNEQFAIDIQLLLLGFGITCRRIHVEKIAGNGSKYNGSELSLRANEAREFVKQIGFVSKEKIKRTSAWLESNGIGRRGIPLTLQDEVVKLDYLGVQSVYDLEVDNLDHLFDAQGILVHNCNPQEAFILTGEDSYIDTSIVMRARKGEAEKYGPLVVGVDPARFGDDRSCIIRRQGRVAFGLESYVKKDTMEITGIVHNIIESEKPFKVFVDVGGLGAGVVDRLNELGHRDVVVAVNAGNSPLDSRRYSNKRSEMWGTLKNWLQDEPCQIPDSNELHSDLCNIKYKVDSNSRLVMEQKAEMKKRGIRSPDCADCICLTFAYPESALEVSGKSSQVAAKLMQKQKSIQRLKDRVYGSI